MDSDREQLFNTIFYLLFIATGFVYLYITVNDNRLSNEEHDRLVTLARNLSVITAVYFLINAIIGLKQDNSIDQYKQIIASLLILIGSLTRQSIKGYNIEFR